MVSHILEHTHCNTWADMGAGKSAAVLTALDILKLAGSDCFPALVLAPLRVARDVWPAEQQKWDHLASLKMVPITGSSAERRWALHQSADVYTINYENIPWLVEHYGAKWPFKTVIADESTKLKNFRLRAGGQRAAALAMVARKTSRWVNLTGTPAPNGLKDLWGQSWFLDYGDRLGKTYTAFKERWFDSNEYTHEVNPKSFAQGQIQGALSDITLTVQLKDWVDLKEPVQNNIFVDMPKTALAQYKKLEKEMFVALENSVELTALSAAALTTKCTQFAAGAVYHTDDEWTEVHTAKLDALDEIIEESAGANIIVFYQYRHDVARIMKRFPQARQLKTRWDVNDWNDGRIPLLLAHPQGAGHGLNLQHGGSTIVWFSLWWALEFYLQANDRLGPARQMQSGYDRVVTQHHILTRGTLDEDVLERLNSKKTVQDVLMNAMQKRG